MTPSAPQPIADEIAGSCLAGRVRLLSRAITGLYDDALRPLGMTAGQLNTLVFIAKHGPLTQGALSQRLAMDKSTLSRNLERMRGHGWIEVKPGPTGNTQLVEIRARGHMVVKHALPRWRVAQTKAEALLGGRGMKALHQAADAVMAKTT